MSTHRINNFCTPQIKVVLDIIDTYTCKSFTKELPSYLLKRVLELIQQTFISIKTTRYHIQFLYAVQWTLPGSVQRTKKNIISSSRAFPIRTYLQRKIFQESAKAPVFPASIQLIFSAFDKNSSASFRHQTTSHDKHVPQRLWLLTVLCSIDR